MATNGTISRESEEAWIVWINSFPLEHKVERLRQIHDGQVIWQMLHEIDQDAFAGKLPNDKATDYSRRQNLQFIHRQIEDYLEDRGKGYNALSDQELERMATESPGAPTAKFLKLVLGAMLESPAMTDQIQKIMTLPPATQEIVGSLMQEVADLGSDLDNTDGEQEDSNGDSGVLGTSPPLDSRIDQILQLEQQYAKIMSQLERRNQEFKDIEAELETVSKSLERAQENNEALNQQINERDNQLKRARSIVSDREQSSMKDLETKISQQEETISSKDNQLSKQQSEIAELEREKRRLLVSDESLQKLQDEFDVMKIEMERQTRKANTADKYMQKLQANQNIEKERDSLRLELDDARNQLGGMKKLRQENAALQQSNDEASRTLSQIEQENEELRMTKKQLRISYDSMARQIDALNERFAQDQETIAELRERHHGSETAASPAMANGGLEGELDEIAKNEDLAKSKSAELQRQNQQLMSDVSEKDAKLGTLSRQLKIAIESAADQTGQISNLRAEVLTLETSLAEVREGHPIEGTVTFKRMRDQVKVGEQKCADLENELAALRQSDTPRDTHEEQQTSQTHDLKGLIEIVQNAPDGQSLDDLTSAVAVKLDEIFAGKMVSRKEEGAKQQQVIEAHEATIKSLEEGLQQEKLARESEKKTEPPPQAQQSPQDRMYIQNLERELRLMASAYHDLASRLQMNTVVLQRRAEAPKSWLGRQRRAMEGPTGLSR